VNGIVAAACEVSARSGLPIVERPFLSESLPNIDLLQTRRSASTVSGAGTELRFDQREQELAGRAAEIRVVRKPSPEQTQL
jgi:hypothetical protein